MIASPVRALTVVGLAGLFATIISAAACGDSGTSTDDDSPPPNTCDGGVIVDGVCEGKCTPDKCLEGNVCVGNRCMLQCTTNTECHSPAQGNPDLQSCEPNRADSETGLNDGESVSVCTEVKLALNFAKPCPGGNECDDAGNPADSACPDGSPCTDGEGGENCSAAECRPLICKTTGEGDADAYCTTNDCTEDAHCGPGMYCGIARAPNPICGNEDKCNPNFCDDSLPCIAPADFNKDGATYQEGPIALLRNQCLKREPCAPCEDNADCSVRPDMACVTLGEEHVCAKTCADDDDCPNDFFCVVDAGFCVPRSGQCKPPPTDNFCYSCLNDLDCGNASNAIACVETNAGQRACFDNSFPDTCTTDDDCPESPSGKHGECLDEQEGVDPSSGAYHRCYLPFFPGPGSFECWQD
ncbi:MAG: hypothetical protein HOW73_10410 [Polyangiaceae bacterium]|nr:hypothetical protein [Polyangiaceae bacterium]